MAYTTASGAVISVSIDGVAQTQAGLDRVAMSMDAMSTRTTASAAQMANAMRMVPAQLTDIIVGLQAGQSPLTVLLQQGGQLRDMFGSVGGAARGVATALANLINPYTVAAAAAGALAYAYNQGSKEADAYNKAIIMTGNAAGTSRDQLADYAKDISKLVGTQGEAAHALAALASTGEVGSEQLKQFGAVAVQVQKYIGRSVEDTAKDLAELGKSPLEASLKLSESYHYLTSAVYQQIKALQDQGKTEEAAEVAQKAYASAFADRANKLKEELGSIERAWMGAKDAASKAWDSFLGIGRKTTPQQELAKIDAQLAALPSEGGTASERGIRAGLLKRRIQVQYEVDKGEWDRQQAEIADKLNSAKLDFDKILDGTLTRAQQKQKAIDRVVNMGLAAGASDEQIRAATKKVEQDFAALDNPLLARLEGNRTVQREVLAGQLQDLENSYKLQLTSEKDYLTQKGALQLKELDLEIGIIKQRKAIDQGKEDKSAYEKDDAELRAALERRKNLVSATSQALAGVDFQSRKSIDALVDGWSRAILVEREAADQEMALFGQTGQARQTAIAQLKLEAEARKLIADRKRENKPMTEQEIADLKASTEAKKADLAVELNRRAALAGAEQLLDANRKFGLEFIADDRQRAAAQLAIEADKWQQLLRLAGEGTDAQKLLQQQYDTWYRNELLRPQLEEQKRIWQAVETTAHDAFIGVFDSGKSAFDRLRDTLKNGLLELLYQMTMKKWIISVGASVGIGSMAGVAQAGNGGTGDLFATPQAVSTDPLMNAVTSATSLYKAISGAASSFGSSLSSGAGQAVTWLGDKFGAEAMSSFGKGMQGFGLDGSLGSAAGYGQTAGAILSKAGGTVAGYMVGSTLNSAISGQYQTGSGVMTAEKIATAVASYVAGPIGGAVAGAVSGLFNRAFGMGDKKVTAQGMRGTLTADALTGTNYANWHQDGGWFRSDRNGTDLTALTNETVKQFTQGLAAIESASSGFASALGVQADWIKGYSKVFDLSLTGDATKDQKVIEDFFTGIGNEIANKLVPNLDQFSKSGEAAAATLERLAGDFQGTDRVAQLLGVSSDALFGASGMQSATAREQLIDLAGGLSVLGQQASFFNQNFLTEAERIAPVAKALDKALASLGLTTIPTTRTEFAGLVRNLIDSGAAATATGAKQIDSLLALGEAFAQVHPDDTADAAAKSARILQERQQLMDELDQLTLSSAAGLQKQRDALDESNRALFDQVQAVKAQQAAIEATKARATTLLSGVDSAYGALQKVVAREKTALQSNIDTHTAAANKLRTLSQALRSTLDSMKGPDQQLADRRNAQAQIRTALAIARAGGPLPDADGLKKALSAVQQDASDQFSTYNDYLRDFYQTQADIADLASITDDSLSIEERSLDVLNKQLDGLDGILASAQEQIDVLKGQSTTLLSIDQAINGLAVSLQAARGNPVVAATSAITSAYQSALGRPVDQSGLEFWQQQAAAGTSTSDIVNAITTSAEARLQGMYQATLGRPGDAAGMQFWMQQLASGTSYSAVQDALTSSDEYRRLHPFAVGTNYVPQTMPALVHEGERIIPAADNRALMARLASPSSGANDTQVLVAEIRRLRETVEQQQRALNRIAESTGRHVELFDTATAGGGPLLVEMA